MRPPDRILSVTLALGLALPIAGLGIQGVEAAPAQSGPYVRDTTDLGGGTGTVTGVATLRDDSVFVASSLGNGTGVLDIMDNPGDNISADDDSVAFPSGVLGVAANEVDDTAYFVTGSPVAWMTQASAADSDWVAVTWGGSAGQEKFVAVADGLSGDHVMTSPDGITWTIRTAAANNRWRSVAWGGPAGQELFVVVAYSGTGNRVMTSPDGITWTARSSAVDNDWRAVTWGGPAGQELFVAVANSGTDNRVMTSPDGITWTTRTSAVNNNWRWVVWGGPTGQEKFVAVAESGTGNRVMTSPDGITWTARTSAVDNNWRSVTWGGPTGQEKFVAVANGPGSGNRIMTSPDGITWTARTSAADNDWSSITWGGPTGQQKFVAVGSSGAGNRVMTSPDGITWTSQASAADNSWRGVTWGGPTGQQKFVAVALSGIGNRVMTSNSASTPSDPRATLRTYVRGTLDDSAPLSANSGGAWAAIAVNNTDDTVYVASQDDTRIYAFNGANLDDSRSIALPTGRTPYALAVNQADDTVYVLSYASSTTAYLTAMRGSNPDDSASVTIANLSAGKHALAIHPTNGTVYVGGYSTSNYGQIRAFSPSLAPGNTINVVNLYGVVGLAVSDDGRRLYASAGNGRAYLYNTSGFDDADVALGGTPGAMAVDDYGWVWTASPSATAGSRSLIQIGTAPTFDSITPTGGLASGGYTATITGSWFTPTTTAAFGDEANVGANVGTPGSNSMTVTVPPGTAGSADVILVNVAGPSQPLGVNDSGGFTYVAPPTPPPVYPASSPRNVLAAPGDASVTVSWTAPADSGSFPITNYAVTSSPGGKTCLTTALTCTVSGLTNGTAYTFTVQALNGAGWSAPSDPSNAVTPRASATPSIIITGTRQGGEIRVSGTTTDLVGKQVRPWFRFLGQTTYTQGAAIITVAADGRFTWTRKANKKTYVYFTHDSVKSNTVVIPAR